MNIQIIDEPKISIYQIGAYQTEALHTSLPIILIGDARSGLPYFRSLNKGLLEANAFAELMHVIPINETNTISDVSKKQLIKMFNKEAKQIYEKELFYVKIKDKGIHTLKKITHFMNTSALFHRHPIENCEDFYNNKNHTLQRLTLGLYNLIYS